jgi:hypothetical protein
LALARAIPNGSQAEPVTHPDEANCNDNSAPAQCEIATHAQHKNEHKESTTKQSTRKTNQQEE